MSNKNKDKSIYDEFPFMEAFPFNEYRIDVVNDDVYYVEDEENGMDFSSMPGLKDLDSPNVVNFTYESIKSDVIITFHDDDILYVSEVADSIKELDGIRELIDFGLKSDILAEKVVAIKHGDEFIAKVSPDFKESKDTFKAVLDSIILLNGIEMSHQLVKNILDLKKNINLGKLNVDEVKSILMYLDFQLHYAKIILGVVIATKIY